jgi:hypothetical protein
LPSQHLAVLLLFEVLTCPMIVTSLTGKRFPRKIAGFDLQIMRIMVASLLVPGVIFFFVYSLLIFKAG